MYDVIDLFAGIGGFSQAAESSGLFRTVAFAECEPYAQRVLRRHWPDVPIFDDVKELTADALAQVAVPAGRSQLGASLAVLQGGSSLPEMRQGRTDCEVSDALADAERGTAERRRESRVMDGASATAQGVAGPSVRHTAGGGCEDGSAASSDLLAERGERALILTAGFPCQDISYAGKGAGLAGERSGLFYEVARLADELRPDYVLMENVAALVTRGLDAVLATMASLGFDCVWSCIPACAVGAPHRRDRIWILATPTTADSADRLQRIYGRVVAGLTPFGDPMWTTPIANEAEKRGNHNEGLRGQAARGETWPTPTCDDASNVTRDSGSFQSLTRNVQQWATPNASTYKGSGPLGSDSQAHRLERCYIDAQVQEAEQKSGSLNPDWVETLMGYPIGYTLPEGEVLRGLPTRWPAGLGAPQHEWEPPRLTTVKEHRAPRLKALGNSIVPQCAMLWFKALAQEHERTNSEPGNRSCQRSASEGI